MNADGGRLPTAGDFEPQPDYRAPRRVDGAAFSNLLAEAERDRQKDLRLAMSLLMQYTGCNDLARSMANLIDEHREYKIRLGIRDSFSMINAG